MSLKPPRLPSCFFSHLRVQQTCWPDGRTAQLAPFGLSTGNLLQIYNISEGARVQGLLFPEKTACKAYINTHGLINAFTANIRTTSKCADVRQFPSPRRFSASTGLPPTRLPPQIKGYPESNLFRCVLFSINFYNTFTSLPRAQRRFFCRKTSAVVRRKQKKLSHHTVASTRYGLAKGLCVGVFN